MYLPVVWTTWSALITVPFGLLYTQPYGFINIPNGNCSMISDQLYKLNHKFSFPFRVLPSFFEQEMAYWLVSLLWTERYPSSDWWNSVPLLDVCVVLLVGTALHLIISTAVSSYLRMMIIKSVIPKTKSDRRERNCIACVCFSVCAGTLSARFASKPG